MPLTVFTVDGRWVLLLLVPPGSAISAPRIDFNGREFFPADVKRLVLDDRLIHLLHFISVIITSSLLLNHQALDPGHGGTPLLKQTSLF